MTTEKKRRTRRDTVLSARHVSSSAVPSSRAAMRFVLLMGILSLFADFTHEGSRSVLGPYLTSLEASAFTVGVITGFGEFLGYALRLVAGRFADATGYFWPTSIGGYIVQMLSVPALFFTHSWQSAAVLIVLERVGRAIRNPPRDVMLSHAGSCIGGYGWAFGIHEAFDQMGAMLGPLVVSFVLARHGNYHMAFGVLVIPAILNLVFLGIARVVYPHPEHLAASLDNDQEQREFSQRYWVYLAGACLVAAGFVDYPLIAFHLSQAHVVSDSAIPIFYAVAMAVSGGASLLFGRLFDKYGLRILVFLTVITVGATPLVFLGGSWSALFGMALWGMGMGVHESIIPAAVTGMVGSARRATAFGVFTSAYGCLWFLGSASIGFLYEHSIKSTVAFCVITQLIAVPFFSFAASAKVRR